MTALLRQRKATLCSDPNPPLPAAAPAAAATPLAGLKLADCPSSGRDTQLKFAQLGLGVSMAAAAGGRLYSSIIKPARFLSTSPHAAEVNDFA